MPPKLTVIMPCYNCERTLRQAVESCYTQGFSDDEFEIVMVDDSSTDNTKELLLTLADEHKNIHLVFHEQNQGGGAARNTAVANAKSEVIFCLDSDDALPSTVLSKMVGQLHTENVDGVLFEQTRYFTSNINKTTIVSNTLLGKRIELKNLFDKDVGYLTQVNFMYTKKAFSQIGGYPTNHGFDTQTFGLLFLAKGLQATISPGTFYYHRQHQTGHQSYYEREYERGLISINSYLALEPIIADLHSGVIELMIHFDIFQKNFHGTNTHLRSTLALYIQSGQPLLHTKEEMASPLAQAYATMCQQITIGHYEQALIHLGHCLETTKKQTPLLLYMYLRISFGLMGYEVKNINEMVADYLQVNHLLNRPKYTRVPKIFNLLNKVLNIVKI